MPVVSIQAKNSGGSTIDCVKVTVEFLDSAGEWLFSSSTYEYDIAPGQTCNFEVAPATVLQNGKVLAIYKKATEYKIEYEIMY